MTRGDVLLAPRNGGKLRELRPLFERAGFTVVDLAEHGIEEEGGEEELERHETFEANALAKARYFYEVSGGIATVADDSGLAVAALMSGPAMAQAPGKGPARPNLVGDSFFGQKVMPGDKTMPFWQLVDAINAENDGKVAADNLAAVRQSWAKHGEVTGICAQPGASEAIWYCP